MLSLSLLKIDNISICSGFPIVFKVLTGQVIVRRVNLIVSCMKVKILISRQLTGLCRRVLSGVSVNYLLQGINSGCCSMFGFVGLDLY